MNDMTPVQVLSGPVLLNAAGPRPPILHAAAPRRPVLHAAALSPNAPVALIRSAAGNPQVRYANGRVESLAPVNVRGTVGGMLTTDWWDGTRVWIKDEVVSPAAPIYLRVKYARLSTSGLGAFEMPSGPGVLVGAAALGVAGYFMFRRSKKRR